MNSPGVSLIDSLHLAAFCAKILDEKHALEIVVLDLRAFDAFADYFLLSTAESSRQFRAIAETLDAALSERRIPLRSVEGLQAGRWLLVDLYDVVVHVFDPEARRFYDLELLWGDAPKLDWKSVETPPIPRAVTARHSRAVRSRS
ncbi:MAG: ribosome silencing factor [Planctomycetes bacterium]|nr:ribosome silencing factor [Planctomycetota bacterium]